MLKINKVVKLDQHHYKKCVIKFSVYYNLFFINLKKCKLRK